MHINMYIYIYVYVYESIHFDLYTFMNRFSVRECAAHPH